MIGKLNFHTKKIQVHARHRKFSAIINVMGFDLFRLALVYSDIQWKHKFILLYSDKILIYFCLKITLFMNIS